MRQGEKMAYGNYKNTDEVAIKYQVRVAVEPFIEPQPMPVPEVFQKELDYVLRHLDVKMSEASISEFLIAPILKEVWRHYDDALLLWSHVSLKVGLEFDGYPDYLITKRSPLGLVRDKPYLLVIEAKKDDFEGGWGQCLAALLAAQEINDDEGLALHGVVSSGDGWQFGRLQGKQFIRDPRLFTIADLADLFAALRDVFEHAKEEAQRT
jgi:hypothetical protein